MGLTSCRLPAYHCGMRNYVAKLTGQRDGHVVSREFDDHLAAIAWLQGAGLAEFSQCAIGEVYAEDGRLIWLKSHLQSMEQVERAATHPVRHFLEALLGKCESR
jgi:hypothetical protein